MANKTVTVKPAGGNYTTLAGAIAGELVANADLTAMAGILNIEIGGTWSSSDTTAVTVNGFTTSAAYYVNIYTDAANRSGASEFSTAKYNLAPAIASGISIQDNYVRINGIQIKIAAGASGITFANIDFTSLAYIDNCRIYKSIDPGAGATYGIFIGDTSCFVKVWNCIIYGFAGTNNTSSAIYCGGFDVAIFNSTLYGNYNGIKQANNTALAKNCAVFNNTDDFSGTITIDYCASDDNDETHNIAESSADANWTADFAASATGNLTLLATSNLVGAALDDPGSGLFLDDIEGNTRTDWDVGAYEYSASGYNLAIQSFCSRPNSMRRAG